MSLVADAMQILGATHLEVHSAREHGDDFEAAWVGCRSGAFLAWFLTRVGLESEHATPELAHAHVVELRRKLGDHEWQRCGSDVDAAFAENFRARYDYETVRGALLRTLTQEQPCSN